MRHQFSGYLRTGRVTANPEMSLASENGFFVTFGEPRLSLCVAEETR